MTELPPITEVVGGSGGIAAQYAEIRSLADVCDGIGDLARDWALVAGRALLDPHLLGSAPLAPVSFGRVEAALVAAAACGVVDAVLWQVDADGCRLAVTALEAADEVARAALDAIDYALARGLATPVAPIAWAVDATPDPVLGLLADRLGPSGPAGSGPLDALVLAHPTIVRHLLNGSGGMLDGLTLGPIPVVAHPTAETAAAEAMSWYDVPGHAAVSTGSSTSSVGPIDLAGLMTELGRISDRADGTIAVQSLPGGQHVVYLPGTDGFGLPWDFNPDVRDAQTDLAAAAGGDHPYLDGVRQAMHEAGVGPDDPVLLVGHSLGGMVAAQLAHESGFAIAGVVTAGSPGTEAPGVPMLSLANRGDLVPMLLGDEPRDTIDHVTVQFDDHEASVIGNHDLAHYVAGAAAVDVSDDRSIRDLIGGWQGFLAGGPTVTQEFTITRQP